MTKITKETSKGISSAHSFTEGMEVPESVPSCGEQEDEKEKAHYWYYLGAAEGLTHSLAGKKPEFEKAWSRFNEANQKFNR